MYDPAKLTMRPNWKEAPKTPGRKQIAAYYAAITAIDEQIGRLRQELNGLGLADDTIVFFTSDHGDMLGSHGLPLKRKPWEESTRVPGILRYPRKVAGGRKERALLTHVDFAPTLLALCGVKGPAGMQGSDLSRVVLGKRGGGPESAFFQIFGPYRAGRVAESWRGVRTERYMYARYETKPWVLYDLEKDPFELNNLVDDPGAAALRKEMDRKLTDWMGKTGDS